MHSTTSSAILSEGISISSVARERLYPLLSVLRYAQRIGSAYYANMMDRISIPVHRRAIRRWQTYVKMHRRLKEDRNQHYNDLDCPCWTDPRHMARFKEQPQHCSCWMCGNPRRFAGSLKDQLTIQERRAHWSDREEWE